MNTNQELPSLRLIVEFLRQGRPMYAVKGGERFRFDLAKEVAPSARHRIRGLLIVRRQDDGQWTDPDSVELS